MNVRVFMSISLTNIWIHSGGSHKSRANSFDFLYIVVLRFRQNLVKIRDQLIQYSQVLFAAKVGFVIELIEVDNAGEDDSNFSMIFRVGRRTF